MFAVAIPCKRDLTALTLLQSGFMPLQHLANPDDRLLKAVARSTASNAK